MHFPLKNTFNSQNIILAANTVLAQYCQKNKRLFYNKYNIEKGEFPLVLSIQDWTKRLWAEYLMENASHNVPLLLEPHQSKILWKNIIKESSDPSWKNLDELAYEAWIIYQHYSFGQRATLSKENIHIQTWKKWATLFDKYCKKHNWLDSHHLLSWLMEENRLAHLTLPEVIFLYGIDTHLPLYTAFFKRLQEHGCCIQVYSKTHDKKFPTIKQITYVDYNAELYSMARWAWQHWGKGDKSIACLIPGLYTQHDYIVSVFQTVYHQQYPNRIETECPLTLLSETANRKSHPIIATALDVLNLSLSFNFESLSRLLRSPYIKGIEQESLARLRLERDLRKQAHNLPSLNTLYDLSLRYHCPQFADCLSKWSIHPTQKTQSFTQWAHYFNDQLSQWQWPAQSLLTQTELNQLKRWKLTLEKLASLDCVAAPCSYITALQQFTHILKTQSYFLHTSSDVERIVLMDVQDNLYGEYFDALWIMDIENIDISHKHHTNPFLPYFMHKNHGVPKLIKQLIQGTGTCVLSASENIASTSCYKVNTLLSEMNLTVEQLKPTDLAAIDKTSSSFIQWETFEDSQAPLISNPMMIENGVDLIQRQADCPFKAFADYRLNLKQSSLKLPQPMLTPSDKTQLINNLLHHCWKQLKQHEKLNQMTDEELNQFLHHIIDNEVEGFIARKPHVWKPVFTQLEKEKLYSFLKDSFSREKVRPPFEVIANDYESKAIIGNLTLTFKLDRLDQLADGSQLLIHYTSQRSTYTALNWIDNPNVAIQFSLYHLSHTPSIKSVSYLNVHPDKQNPFYGISEYDIHIKGVHTMTQSSVKTLPIQDWSALTQHWNSAIQNLLQTFQAGDAQVKPKDRKTTCHYCKHAILCRIAQTHETASEN
jgi:probable DNA repair protein